MSGKKECIKLVFLRMENQLFIVICSLSFPKNNLSTPFIQFYKHKYETFFDWNTLEISYSDIAAGSFCIFCITKPVVFVVFYSGRSRNQFLLAIQLCHICQSNKKQLECKKYGNLPPKEAEITPRKRVGFETEINHCTNQK